MQRRKKPLHQQQPYTSWVAAWHLTTLMFYYAQAQAQFRAIFIPNAWQTTTLCAIEISADTIIMMATNLVCQLTNNHKQWNFFGVQKPKAVCAGARARSFHIEIDTRHNNWKALVKVKRCFWTLLELNFDCLFFFRWHTRSAMRSCANFSTQSKRIVEKKCTTKNMDNWKKR